MIHLCVCVCVCVRACVHVCVCSVYLSFQQSFSHITAVSGYDRELNALFYCAASLWYQVPDTYLASPSHYADMGRPVLALPGKLSAKGGATCTIVNDFGMSRPGIEPSTSLPQSRHFTYYATEAGF